jgi:periplasmic copper chaperone A
MKRTITVSVGFLVCILAAQVAPAHNVLTSVYAPAGYVHDMEMRVTHGCKGSPVNEVRLKIPEGVTRVSAGYNRDWQIELKMRKLPKPVPGEGGTMITETVDEIVWKNPKSPLPASGMFEGFKFRGSLPDKPGEILFFKTINTCVKGDDKYVDMPKEPLNAKTPGLSDKLWAFMTATPGPSPFLILEKPSRPQYPFAPPASAKRPAQ